MMQRVGHDCAHIHDDIQTHSSPYINHSFIETRDGGAWWAAVYGVAQSRIRLKRRSSSRALKWETSNLSVSNTVG